MTVAITGRDLSARALRAAAAKAKDAMAARRMLAIARVLEGLNRKTAAESCGMDRQTLRDWIHRYNAAGLAGRRSAGPPAATEPGSEGCKRALGAGGSRPCRGRGGALAARRPSAQARSARECREPCSSKAGCS